jgi:hypothetical protein
LPQVVIWAACGEPSLQIELQLNGACPVPTHCSKHAHDFAQLGQAAHAWISLQHNADRHAKQLPLPGGHPGNTDWQVPLGPQANPAQQPGPHGSPTFAQLEISEHTPISEHWSPGQQFGLK